jgi:hypothetical protein
MAARTVFSPSHSALDNIFAAETTYVIPAYQRPYSWQALGKSDKNNQVNQMWEDLWSFFEDNPDDKEYFLGSMVVIEMKRRQFEVIDGQQRLTTLSLLFAAMRCFFRQLSNVDPEMETFRADAIARLETLLFNRVGIGLVQEMKVRIQRASGYNFDDVLAAAIQCEESIKVDDPRYHEVAERYFDNRRYFARQLHEKFLDDGCFTIEMAKRFNNFFTFLFTRVSIVLITTADFETAYFIFETLNNRGLPLTGRDLLRNFLIKQLAEAKHSDPADAWVKLEADFALTEDFIGRWVESTKAAQQRTSAFNEMGKIYEKSFHDAPGKPKALVFYDSLRRDLAYYSLGVEADTRISSLVIRNKVNLIYRMGNERYSMNLLLALFRHYRYDGEDNVEIADFLRYYERWMLHVLLAPGVRFSNSNVYRAIRELKDGAAAEAKAAFDLSKDQRKMLLDVIKGDLLDNGTAKLLIAAYVWHEEVQNPDDVATQQLSFDKSTLEHIIPQNPDKNGGWHRDLTPAFRKEYTYKLGNMTLLTGKMNSGAKNYDFAKKQQIYKKTVLPITRELAGLASITPDYIEERHKRIVLGIRSELGL